MLQLRNELDHKIRRIRTVRFLNELLSDGGKEYLGSIFAAFDDGSFLDWYDGLEAIQQRDVAGADLASGFDGRAGDAGQELGFDAIAEVVRRGEKEKALELLCRRYEIDPAVAKQCVGKQRDDLYDHIKYRMISQLDYSGLADQIIAEHRLEDWSSVALTQEHLDEILEKKGAAGGKTDVILVREEESFHIPQTAGGLRLFCYRKPRVVVEGRKRLSYFSGEGIEFRGKVILESRGPLTLIAQPGNEIETEGRRIVKKDRIQVVAGVDFSLLLDEQGELYGFGNKKAGVFPDDNSEYMRPTMMFDGIHTMAAGNSLWLGGDSSGGFVKAGNSLFSQVRHSFEKVKMAEAGNHCCGVLTEDGQLWTWGNETDSHQERQIVSKWESHYDDKTYGSQEYLDQFKKHETDTMVLNKNIHKPDAYHSVYQYSVERVQRYFEPKLVQTGIAGMSFGNEHCCSVSENGQLFTWGTGQYGQLGYGVKGENRVPRVAMIKVRQASAGLRHTVVLKSDGTVWVFGDNRLGQLIRGAKAVLDSPREIAEFKDKEMICVSAGADYSLAVERGGSLYVWGKNSHGRLGIGNVDQCSPQKILDHVVTVCAGPEHAMAVTGLGEVYTWGRNDYGQLGDGTRMDRYRPVKIWG